MTILTHSIILIIALIESNKKHNMKNSPNKFIKHLADDIVSENHHLKDEVIKIRKVLKSYENQMVDQFTKLAKEIGEIEEEKQGFLFEAPQEYLKYFIRVLNSNVHRAYQFQQKNKYLEAEWKQSQKKKKILEALVTQLKNKQENYMAIIAKLQHQVLNYEKKCRELQVQFKQKQKNLTDQINELKAEKTQMANNFNIKYLQQKKTLLQKANKQSARLRAQMDAELHQKQKAMKHENDKRDREIKSLLNSLNSIVENKEKQGSSHSSQKPIYKANLASSLRLTDVPIRKVSEIDLIAEQTPSNKDSNPISFLSEVIKPFTEHTHLLEKLSESKKEVLLLKTQTRQQSTSLVTLTATVAQKQNQIELLRTKNIALQQKHDKMYEDLINTSEQLAKSNEDKNQMEKYYNERWNTEINNVKYNMQKKYIDKENHLEEKYKQQMENIEIQKQQIRIEKIKVREEVEKLHKINKDLRIKLQKIEKQNQRLTQIIRQSQRKIVEIETMHNEDVRSLKVRYANIIRELLEKIQKHRSQIQKLNQFITQIEDKNQLQLINLKQQIELIGQQKIKKLKMVYEQQIEELKKQLSKLSFQLEGHKVTIQGFQRSQAEKMQEMRQKITKQKQKQLRDIKVAHLQQISKFNQKTLKLQQRLKSAKGENLQKTLEHQHIARQLEQKIDQQKNNISELHIFLKTNQAERKSLKKQIQGYQKEIAQYYQNIKSLQTQISSLKLVIKNKQSEIFTLTQEKKSWKNDILSCKKQFQKGFKELQVINQKKIEHYRSRIWELQRICEVGGISRKDYQKIRSLTSQKKKLQEKIIMQEAQNLILSQVKNYYENKSKELDTKIVIGYELKDQKRPIMIRKPKRNQYQLKILKTQISEDLDGFTGKEAIEVKKFITSRNKDRSEGKLQTAEESEYRRNSRPLSKSKVRVNSSLM